MCLFSNGSPTLCVANKGVTFGVSESSVTNRNKNTALMIRIRVEWVESDRINKIRRYLAWLLRGECGFSFKFSLVESGRYLC